MKGLLGCLLSVFLLASISLHPATHHAGDNAACATCASGRAVAAPQAPAISAPQGISSLETAARAVPPPRPFRLPTRARAPPTSVPAY